MVETAPYDVVRRIGDVEIRSYPRLIFATVTGRGDDGPFNLLVNYIGGDNKGRSKISMTTPVLTSEKVEMTAPVITRGDSMSFVLPSRYTSETAPEPSNPRVLIHEMPARTLAVIRFRGYARQSSESEHTRTLLDSLAENRIETVGEPVLMRYNAPWTPGFMRRNEIAIEINEKS